MGGAGAASFARGRVRRARRPKENVAFVRMRVTGIALDPRAATPVVLLAEEGKPDPEARTLHIWIGQLEAMAIAVELEKIAHPRPLTHELMAKTVAALGGQVVGMQILELREGTFYARLLVRQGDATLPIDSRPSDALAAALHAGAPIECEERVLQQVLEGEVPPKPEGAEPGERDKWTELLEGLDPRAFGKYKQ